MENAVRDTISAGARTGDLVQTGAETKILNTQEITKEILNRI